MPETLSPAPLTEHVAPDAIYEPGQTPTEAGPGRLRRGIEAVGRGIADLLQTPTAKTAIGELVGLGLAASAEPFVDRGTGNVDIDAVKSGFENPKDTAKGALQRAARAAGGAVRAKGVDWAAGVAKDLTDK